METKITVNGKVYILHYNEKHGYLECVTTEAGTQVWRESVVNGVGVCHGPKSLLGNPCVLGAMVKIDKADIYVPYKIFFAGVPD
jgi:hypothetical protein